MTQSKDRPREVWVGVHPDTGRLDARYGKTDKGDYFCDTSYIKRTITAEEAKLALEYLSRSAGSGVFFDAQIYGIMGKALQGYITSEASGESETNLIGGSGDE